MIRNAAVIILHEQDTNSLILTQRTSQLRDHPGEICFPGGRWQAGDKNFYETALRELHEELGIERARVQFQKMMKPELTLTGYLIYPWLALIPTLEPYHMDQNEVADVFRLPLEAVCNIANYKEIFVKKNGFNIKTYQFKDNKRFVWGATARIMKQLSVLP